jgi:hypothetical protein
MYVCIIYKYFFTCTAGSWRLLLNSVHQVLLPLIFLSLPRLPRLHQLASLASACISLHQLASLASACLSLHQLASPFPRLCV